MLLALVTGAYFLLQRLALHRVEETEAQTGALQQEGSVRASPIIHQASPNSTAEMAATAAAARATMPALFLPHGGGPFPVLGEPGHAGLTKFLMAWSKTVPKPSSILVVSAHWEVRGCRAGPGAATAPMAARPARLPAGAPSALPSLCRLPCPI